MPDVKMFDAADVRPIEQNLHSSSQPAKEN